MTDEYKEQVQRTFISLLRNLYWIETPETEDMISHLIFKQEYIYTSETLVRAAEMYPDMAWSRKYLKELNNESSYRDQRAQRTNEVRYNSDKRHEG